MTGLIELVSHRGRTLGKYAPRLLIAGIMPLVMVMVLMVTSAAASIDNQGKDFILAFLPNHVGSGSLELHLTSATSTNVTVEYPVNSPTFTTTVAVNPGAVTIVSVPGTADAWSANVVSNNAVRAHAPNEFVAYMINRRQYTSDAALGLPIDTMNTQYIVSNYSSGGPEFVVYAAFDSTTVTITPSDTFNGHTAGVPFNVALDRGEAILFNGGSTQTGTIVESDKPVGMANGNNCIFIIEGACDHIFEVAQPVQSWGLSTLGANLPLRPNGTVYRVLASQDGTTVSIDGTVVATLNGGQFYDTGQILGNHEFTGDKPIYVTQYMTGQPSGGTGDPAMGNLVPPAQYADDYTFSTVGGGQFAENFVTIIADAADAAASAVLLDGNPVSPASFAPIGPSHAVAIVPLAGGTHTTQSPNPHGITVQGYNSFDSYLYPGGALFKFINPVGDANPPIVTVAPPAGSPPTIAGLAKDDRPSEDTNGNGVLDPGEDLNGDGLIDEDTGIFFIELDAGATNLVVTPDPFTPGDTSVAFTVSLLVPGTDGTGVVVVTDGAGNETRVRVSVEILANQDPLVSADNGAVSTPEGADASNTGAVSDPDGDAVTLTASAGTVVNNGDGTWSWSNAAPDGPDAYSVTIDADDGNGGTNTATFDVTVLNVAPDVAADNDPVFTNEGTDAANSGTYGDVDADTVTLSADFGNLTDNLNGTWSWSNSAPDGPDSYTVTITATDDDGGTSTATFEVTVNNVAPDVDAGPDQSITFGAVANLAASFGDPGADADWTVDIDWGDGATESSTTMSAGAIDGTHQYLSLGEHTVEICVTDKDGATGCDTLTVTVSNTEGKVTGGVSTIDGDGKGGFVVQNKKGKIKGSLQFKDDTTNFHANEMTALAVSEDETSAWFAGVGKDGRGFVAYVEDNGEPNVEDIFQLWIDGILHGGTGEMDGGNIQIH